MIHWNAKIIGFFATLAFLFWALILGFTLSGTQQYCNFKSHADCRVSKTQSDFMFNFSPAEKISDCCSQTKAGRVSKADYIINSGDEINFRLSSKRFHILPHGIYENSRKSFSEKASDVKLEPASPAADIPIDISSLLI
jgi:hypothetical protein